MKNNFILLSIVLSLQISCKNEQIPFDKIGWNKPCDGVPCPVIRDKMIDDLLKNHKLIGLSYRQIISKLGDTDNSEDTSKNIMRYEISTEYTFGDIVHINALDLHYNKDSIVTSYIINNYDIDM